MQGISPLKQHCAPTLYFIIYLLVILLQLNILSPNQKVIPFYRYTSGDLTRHQVIGRRNARLQVVNGAGHNDDDSALWLTEGEEMEDRFALSVVPICF